jgi:hypothetical protein
MTRSNHDLTPEQQAEAERIFEVLQEASKEEQWRIAQLLASKRDDQIFGQTEYEVRDEWHFLKR